MALPNQDHNIAYSSQTLAKQVLENTSARVVLLVGANLESRLSNQQRVILHCVQWESSHDAILPENTPIVPFV